MKARIFRRRNLNVSEFIFGGTASSGIINSKEDETKRRISDWLRNSK